MSNFGELLKSAGVDTLGARLTTACTEAIRTLPAGAGEIFVWHHMGPLFGLDFVRSVMSDMRFYDDLDPIDPKAVAGIQREADKKIKAQEWTITEVIEDVRPPAPYQPRVIAPQRLEKRREIRRLLASDGTPWGCKSWQEIKALRRDGGEAAALLDALPGEIPNDGSTPDDTFGGKRVDEIIAKARLPNL